MPRRFKISMEDKQLIQQANRRIKAKQSRLKAKGFDVILPTKQPKEFNSKKQIEKYLEEQNKISKTRYYYNRKTKKLLPASDYGRLQDAIMRRNRLVKERYGEALESEFTTAGRPTGNTVGAIARSLKAVRLGNTKFDPLLPRNLTANDIRDEKHLQELLDRYNQQAQEEYWQERDERLKQNYIKSLSTAYGDIVPEEVKELQEKLKNMDLQEFMKAYYSDDIVSITYNYTKDPNYSEAEKLNRVINAWSSRM